MNTKSAKKYLITVLGFCIFSVKAWSGNLLSPVSFDHVYIDDFFWYYQYRSQKLNTLPFIWEHLKNNGFMQDRYKVRDLEDADLYQLLETMSYIYVMEPDSLQKGRLDTLASMIPEGIAKDLNFKWIKHPRENAHPLYYQMAAFYRAALAYTRAGGQRPLLEWALCQAELLSKKVLQAPKKIRSRDLHPNIALVLGDLYQLTNQEAFLKAAQLMLEKMADNDWGLEQGYYYAAQAWLSGLTHDEERLKKNHLFWQEAVNRTMRITGGFSAFPDAKPAHRFVLPETMANMEWCLRLYGATQDARCMELYERAMYNELRAGISFHGGFVAHDLTVDEQKDLKRDSINQVPLGQLIPLIRNMAVLPDYYYATRQDTAVYVNQYFRGEVKIKTQKLDMKLSSVSSMPWVGGFYMDVLTEKPQTCTFYLRMPAWMTDECLEGMGRYRFVPMKKHIRVAVNGVEQPVIVEHGFLKLSGTWNNHDRIVFDFLSSVRKIVPKTPEEADTAKLAFQRAAFVFCQEMTDTLYFQQEPLAVYLDESLAAKFALRLMGGVQTLEGRLYDLHTDSKSQPLFLTPYFARGQRGSARTKIWFPYFTERRWE